MIQILFIIKAKKFGNEITYQNDLTDLFGIDTKLKGKIKNWGIDFKSSNNSIDPNKLRESSRLKLNIKKSIELIKISI